MGTNLTAVNAAPNGCKSKQDVTNDPKQSPVKQLEKRRKPQGRSKLRPQENEDESEESESIEELFDAYVLSKLKF